MIVNVCVPVLKRYDLLRDMLQSLRQSTVLAEAWIIDNGRQPERLAEAIDGAPVPVHTHEPDPWIGSMGIAESWNWFLKNVPEERVITNDDVVFAPDSLAKLLAANTDIAWAAGCGFACFIIRDTCVEKIGLFDETISPGYGYYEDEDYLQRLDGRGTRPPSASGKDVDCGVVHLCSQTLAIATAEEQREHHQRFYKAQRNYAVKWGLEKAFGL